MVQFTDGSGGTQDFDDPGPLREKLFAHDRAFWNGAAGQSALEHERDGRRTFLYVTLVPEEEAYLLIHQFPDRSTIVPRAAGEDARIVEVWIGGNPMPVPRDRLVGAAHAAAILDHFFRSGEPDPDLDWAIL